MKWKGKVDFDVTPKVGATDLELTGHTHVEADVTDLGAYITGITGEPLGDLNNVVLTSPVNTEVLKYNGTNWVNAAAGAGGDVTAAANLGDNCLVRGDGGVKGIQDSGWAITDNGEMTSSISLSSGYILDVHNTYASGGGNGFRIKAGEALGDIAFHVADQDDTFQIMELEADQGYCTFGKTYAQTLTDNGTVYGIDIQHTGNAKDFNTQAGVYRIGGDAVMHGTHYEHAASEGESSTTSATYVQKLRLTTSSLPSGIYRIGWTYAVKGGGDSHGRVQLNDTTELDFSSIDSSTNDYNSNGGFYVTGTISGVQNIDIDYLAGTGTAYIKYARLEIWRIS